MFYTNRQAVGEQLAQRLKENHASESHHGSEPIIFCLKQSSLLSCVELAARINAYVYIMRYEPVPDPYAITRDLGAVTETGQFVLNPEITRNEFEYIQMNFASVVEENKRVAFSKINQSEDPNPKFNKTVFNGRNIFLCSDILQDCFQIEVANEILKPYTPLKVHGAIGNISPSASDKFKIDTDGVTYLDVLPNNIFDDDHYFDQPDEFNEREKILLANNISLYWV